MHKSEKVEQVAIGELIPYVNNSRTHPEKQIEQIASSMREFGFTAPILCDENNTVLAGHGRLQLGNLDLERFDVRIIAGGKLRFQFVHLLAENFGF